MNINLHFFVRPPSELVYTDEEVSKKFTEFMYQEELDIYMALIVERIQSLRYILIAILVCLLANITSICGTQGELGSTSRASVIVALIAVMLMIFMFIAPTTAIMIMNTWNKVKDVASLSMLNQYST